MVLGGAQYYKDKESGEWFVAMDETRTKAYTTGGTLTRDFGPKKLPIIVDNMIVNDFSTPIAGLADFAAYKRTKDVSKIYNSMFTQYLSITSQKFEGHDLILGIEHLSDDLTSDYPPERKGLAAY